MSESAASASVNIHTTAFDDSLDFFMREAGFRLDSIYPADAPDSARLSGHGLAIHLHTADTAQGAELTVSDPAQAAGEQRSLRSPEGSIVHFVAPQPAMHMPALAASLVVCEPAGANAWHRGRAGMLYRDLLPDRLGGRFIASHIRIPEGGPVPDYVHYHEVRFQMIFCYRGWVRVAYEDQGDSLVMHPGDCVLQPPGIRHRVLEASDGLEVVEVGTPAKHFTHVEHELTLPTGALRPEREFGGQLFVFHQAAGAPLSTAELAGFQTRDLGINAATRGLALVQVHRAVAGTAQARIVADGELCFLFIMEGKAEMRIGEQHFSLAPGAACAIPAGMQAELTACSEGLELLQVRLPGDASRVNHD